MENNGLDLNLEEFEKPDYYYETVYEATEEISVCGKTETRVKGRILKKVQTDEEEIQKQRHSYLKTELAKIKEDIEQETFGIVRDDYVEKKAWAAEIINELRMLEGKEPRAVTE